MALPISFFNLANAQYKYQSIGVLPEVVFSFFGIFAFVCDLIICIFNLCGTYVSLPKRRKELTYIQLQLSKLIWRDKITISKIENGHFTGSFD